jgi:CBS domain-containing protein
MLFGKSSKETSVAEIMTPAEKMFTVNPANTVEECMVLMTAKHIRHLPVCDAGKFAGLISIGDVVKAIISEKDALIEQLSNYIGGKYM